MPAAPSIRQIILTALEQCHARAMKEPYIVCVASRDGHVYVQRARRIVAEH